MRIGLSIGIDISWYGDVPLLKCCSSPHDVGARRVGYARRLGGVGIEDLKARNAGARCWDGEYVCGKP